MFDFIDFEAAVEAVKGKTYEHKRIVTFTITEVKEKPKYKSFDVYTVDEDGSSYKFTFGGDKLTAKKQALQLSFLLAFFKPEELKAKTAKPVTIIGSRFQVQSGGQTEWQGKTYQQWEPNFKKLDSVASVEDFT